jgi:surfeit locus 1 family protein
VTVTPKGLLATIAAVLIAAVCVRLGFWQLDRLEQRRERNAAIIGAASLPALDLSGDSLGALMRHPDGYHYRHVRVRGAYLPAGDFLLRGRAMDGRPGVHLVTPLRIAGTDTAILVLRGWIPANDAATADPRPYAASGEREVEGVVQTISTAGAAIPLQEKVNGATVATYQRIDPRAVQSAIPYPLVPAYLQIIPTPAAPPPPRAAGSAPELRRVPLPPLDEGPHLGYAMQWFGFAAVAIFGMVVVLVKQNMDAR